MSKKQLSTQAAMAILMATALGGGGLDMLGPVSREKKPKDQMPLTPEEKTALACLSGKEKKQYVKMLKEKYNK